MKRSPGYITEFTLTYPSHIDELPCDTWSFENPLPLNSIGYIQGYPYQHINDFKGVLPGIPYKSQGDGFVVWDENMRMMRDLKALTIEKQGDAFKISFKAELKSTGESIDLIYTGGVKYGIPNIYERVFNVTY